MAKKELKAALRAISAVLNDPRIEQGQRDQLLTLRRALEGFARSGKVDRQKVYRIIELVANVLLDVVER